MALLFASVATAELLVTRDVSTTAQLHAALADVTVNDIVAANGTYLLGDEPKVPALGCAPDPVSFPVWFSLCINRNLTIRVAAGATVVLDGGGKKGVVLVFGGVTVYLQGLQITNGNTTERQEHAGTDLGYPGGGILNCGTLTLTDCDVHHNNAYAGGGISNGLPATGAWPASYKCTAHGVGPTSPWGYGTLHVANSSVHHNSGGGILNGRDQDAGGVSTLTISNSAVFNNSFEVRTSRHTHHTPPRSPSLLSTHISASLPPVAWWVRKWQRHLQ